MTVVRKILLGLVLLVSVAISGILALGYGWVPLFGFEYMDDYFGEAPDSWVASYGAGWTDHRLYLILQPETEWIEPAMDHADLVPSGEMGRFQCLEPFASPWWFALAPQTQGVCWVRRQGYAGKLRAHYAPESGFLYVFDYST